ncbi:MAG TPA: aldo/keto reductase [Nevskiaceae bacterium]
MQTLRFSNGDTIPQLGLGTWKSRPGDVYNAVRTALRLGFRHIDCAYAYDNEAEIGHALADAMSDDGVRREELWITSKLWNTAHAPDDVRPALEATLRHLQLDHLDLYLMHWPVAMRKGSRMPLKTEDLINPRELPFTKTWVAMEACVDAGLARHIGVSNFSARKIKTLLDEARIKPAMDQVELHPYLQQQPLVDFCRAHGVQVTAYSPLGSNDRPKGMKGKDEPVLLEDASVAALAKAHGATPAQILIAWALARGTAVIPKSTSAEHMQDNLDAADITLSDAEMKKIAALDRHRRYIDGRFWALPGSGYTLENIWDE